MSRRVNMQRTSLGGIFWVSVSSLILLIAGWESSAYGSDYYVAPAPSGSDTNPGTITQPWRTIQKAADTINAGDTVYIRGRNVSGTSDCDEIGNSRESHCLYGLSW